MIPTIPIVIWPETEGAEPSCCKGTVSHHEVYFEGEPKLSAGDLLIYRRASDLHQVRVVDWGSTPGIMSLPANTRAETETLAKTRIDLDRAGDKIYLSGQARMLKTEKGDNKYFDGAGQSSTSIDLAEILIEFRAALQEIKVSREDIDPIENRLSEAEEAIGKPSFLLRYSALIASIAHTMNVSSAPALGHWLARLTVDFQQALKMTLDNLR